MPPISSILIALALTAVAGLSTGLGALVAFFTKKTDTRVLSAALGLSAGVMLYVSFMEMLPEAIHGMAESVCAPHAAHWWVALAFFGGIGLIALIDKLVPEDENPHEVHTMDELQRPGNHHLKRTGIMLALAIGIHNFPEGMAAFVSALDGAKVALPIIVAIAIHNIPEGVAVSVPIYHSTGSRRKALRYTLLSGLAEPIGALVGMLFLLPFWSPLVNSICLAVVAGIMVYISLDELLPGAESYGHHHIALAFVITGMAIMALTLLMMQ